MAWKGGRKKGGKNRRVIPSKSMAMSILSLFDFCYKRGVSDACNARDDMLCKQFVEKTQEPGVYGFIWKPRQGAYNLETWDNKQMITELTVMTITENVRYKQTLYRQFSRLINPTTYHYCLLHIAQEMYNTGILDYLKNPNYLELPKMQQWRWVEWTNHGVRRSDTAKMMTRMQIAAFDRARLSEIADEDNKNRIKRKNFEIFQKDVWSMLNDVEIIWQDEF